MNARSVKPLSNLNQLGSGTVAPLFHNGKRILLGLQPPRFCLTKKEKLNDNFFVEETSTSLTKETNNGDGPSFNETLLVKPIA